MGEDLVGVAFISRTDQLFWFFGEVDYTIRLTTNDYPTNDYPTA